MNAHAFIDGAWHRIRRAYCFHAGIGFVELYSIKVFNEGEWIVVGSSEDQRVLVGA